MLSVTIHSLAATPAPVCVAGCPGRCQRVQFATARCHVSYYGTNMGGFVVESVPTRALVSRIAARAAVLAAAALNAEASWSASLDLGSVA